MKAWLLDRLGGTLKLDDVPIPEPRPGSVIVKIEASALMSYLKAYVEGRLPIYSPPEGWFTPGGNAVGIVHEIGPEVYHLKRGQRVMVSSHVVADENVPAPAQFLLGITAGDPGGKALQTDWRDGTLAEYVRAPKASVTAIDGLDAIDPVQLAVLPRFAVPYGGFIRARLAAGETLIVTGATGAYGSAAVLLALALGAARVVAAGRNASKLDALKRVGGARVAVVTLSGDIMADAKALRAAAGGGADAALDIVGNAQDPNATLAALRALRRGGRLVLMGGMGVPLPIPYLEVMLNNLEIVGQFMYPRDVFRRLAALTRSGLLDIGAIRTRSFPLEALPSAMDAGAQADGLECIVVKPT